MNESKFDFINNMGSNADADEKPKLNIKFWELSKGSRIYGLGTGASRKTHMCKDCGAVVGDYQLHARWHERVEKVILGKVELTTDY